MNMIQKKAREETRNCGRTFWGKKRITFGMNEQKQHNSNGISK